MNNRSTELRLSQNRKVMQEKKENGTESEQGLRIHVTRRMFHNLRGSTHQIQYNDIDLRSRIRSPCNVGLVEEIIAGEFVHSARVVGLRYTVCRRHRLLETLVKVFHVSMQHWITNRQNIKHLSLTWMVSFVTELFLF